MKGAGVIIVLAVAAAALGGGQSNAPSRQRTQDSRPGGESGDRCAACSAMASAHRVTMARIRIRHRSDRRRPHRVRLRRRHGRQHHRRSHERTRHAAARALYIDVTGDDGNLHRYLHLLSVAVKAGQRVRRDQPIATIDGTHLHFELRKGRNGGTHRPRLRLATRKPTKGKLWICPISV